MSQQLIDTLNAHPNISNAATSKHYYELWDEDSMTAVRARISRDEWDEDCVVVMCLDDVLLDEHEIIAKLLLAEADRAGAERYA